MWCVVVCDLENLIKNEEAMARVGLQRHRKKKSEYIYDAWTPERYTHGRYLYVLLTVHFSNI